jgi:transposase
MTWTGDQGHLSATGDEEAPHLITHGETTQATIPDVTRTEPIHQALSERGLAPEEHLVDAGYTAADLLVRSQAIRLIGPARPKASWQARMQTGYRVADFTLEWDRPRAICAHGHASSSWTPHQDRWGNAVIAVPFSRTDGRRCPARARCTRAAEAPRHMTIRHQADHEALEQVRAQETTPDWTVRSNRRAGGKGLLSPGTRAFALRQARYRGMPQVHLQHLATAVAINVVRLVAWDTGIPLAKTRCSPFAALKLAS